MMKRIVGDDLARFESHIDKSGTCWIWTAAKDKHGYGLMWFRGRLDKAYRVSWALHRGDIPQGMSVCHKCDTPSCVNPDHLFIGTQAENLKDMRSKGRQSLVGPNGGQLVGSLHQNSVLTELGVIEMRRRHAAGEPQASIARSFGVAPVTAHKAIRGVTWKHVESVA